jgi:hypothetical protein
MALFDSEDDKEHFVLMLESAVTKGVSTAMDKHINEKHDKIDEDMQKLFKFRTQATTLTATLMALGSVAWGDLKGFFNAH